MTGSAAKRAQNSFALAGLPTCLSISVVRFLGQDTEVSDSRTMRIGNLDFDIALHLGSTVQ